MRIEQAQLVRAPREQVFEAWADCEAWPTWDHVLFSRVRVTERVGNTKRIDAQVRFMGMRMPRKERHILTPPEKIEVIGDVPNAINTTVWTFETVPEGTMLTAVLDIEFKGWLKLLQPLAARQGRTALYEWMRALAKHVEAQ